MPPGWFLCLTRCVFSFFHPHQSALCSFMHLLLIVNASTNFLIYCFMGNKFKTVLLAMVRELVKGKEQVGRHGKCFGTKTFCLGKITTKKKLCRWEPALSSWQTKPLGSRETSQRYTITIIFNSQMISTIVQATTLTLAASPIPPRDHEDLGNSLALEQPANGAHSVTQV